MASLYFVQVFIFKHDKNAHFFVDKSANTNIYLVL